MHDVFRILGFVGQGSGVSGFRVEGHRVLGSIDWIIGIGFGSEVLTESFDRSFLLFLLGSFRRFACGFVSSVARQLSTVGHASACS